MAKREEIGERLTRKREEKRLTLKAAADAIGVPKSTYGNWEKGKLPDPETLEKLVDFLGVSYDWLFSGKEREPSEATGADLTTDESNILRIYRETSPEGRNDILKAAIGAQLRSRL